jgi:hypothetical protein
MATFAKSPEVVFTELEDGAVLLDMNRGLYFSLNDVGSEIWGSIEPSASTDDVARTLTSRFDVEDSHARRAVETFVDQLRQADLVVPSDAPGERTPGSGDQNPGGRGDRAFSEPALVQHEEPLHEVATSPFDAQLPLAE